MNKFLKILIVVAGVTLLLLIISYFVISAFLTNEKIRDIASEVTSEAIQRPVEIGGVGLRIGFKIGITIEDISVANVKGFSDDHLLQVEQVTLNLKLLPLLERQIVIGSIDLSGIEAHIERNKKGDVNIATMTPKESKGMSWSLVLSSINISKAEIGYIDRVSDTEIKIKDLNQNIKFKDNKYIFAGKQDIHVVRSKTFPEMTVKMTNHIEYDTLKKDFNIKKLTAIYDPIHLTAIGTISQDAIKDIVIHGHIGKTEFDVTGTINNLKNPIFDLSAKVEGNLQDFESLVNNKKKIRLNGLLNIDVSIKGPIEKMTYSGNFTIKDAQIGGIGSAQPITKLCIIGSLKNDVGTIDECRGYIGRSDFSFKGRISNFKKPIIHIKNKSNLIDLDDLLPEVQEEGRKEGKPLPIRLQGDVQINMLTGIDMEFKNINTNFTYENGIIDLKNCSAEAFGGKVNFDFYYNVHHPESYRITTKMTSISTREILTRFLKFENIEGGMTGVSNFQGRGFTQKEVTSNLAASGNLKINNGRFRNFTFLTGLLSWLGLKDYREVKFNDLSCNFTIDKGKARVRDWMLSSSNGDFLTNGTIGLDGRLNLSITTTLEKKESNIVKNYHGDWLFYFDNNGRAVIDIIASGTLTAPKFSLDKKKIKKRLEGKIKDKFDEKKNEWENKLKDLFGR